MFGFLKDKLKKTVEKFTKEVDAATKKVEPTEEQKKEILEEIKQEEQKKGFFSKLKDTFTGKQEPEQAKIEQEIKKEKIGIKKETVPIKEEKESPKKEEKQERKVEHKEVKAEKKEVVLEKVISPFKEEKSAPLKQRVEEGEKEIEVLLDKKKHEKEQEQKKEQPPQEKKEEKGFFARLKDKLVKKEEKQEQVQKEGPAFEVQDKEVEEFEQAFKEVEEVKKEQLVRKEEEEIIPVVTETETGETVFELKEKPSAVSKKKETKKEEKRKEEKKEHLPQEKKAIVEDQKEETGLFAALKDTLFKTSLSQEKFEELFWDLEVILLENNVAVEVIELIKENLKKDLVDKKILRGKINDIILSSLRDSIEQAFSVERVDIFEKIKEKKPFIIVFVGINGSGKTTTIAKMAHKLKQQGLSCVIAAGDTFRAAAIQQLEEHATKLNIKMIKHNYGADPAAVGFDAIKYAEAHHIDCVLIDTAGRLHSNTNLMDEMKKIIRVTKPDMKLFIGEAITGNDCVEQARNFHEAIGIDGIILAKADIDEKGGAALSVSYVTGKPILYLGSGQGYDDLQEFDKEKIMGQLGLA